MARLYDRAVSSRGYNRLAWSTDPDEYEAFAAEAVGSSDGPLLEVASGPATFTLPLHVASGRATVLSDRSVAMLELSRRRARTLWDDRALVHLAWRELDMFAELEPGRWSTILGSGLLHMVEDPAALVDSLLRGLAPGGGLWLSGLVANGRRSSGYLAALHRIGEVAPPRAVDQLRRSLPAAASVRLRGAMAYVHMEA